MTRAVFVYGTLTFPEIAAAVTGRALYGEPATLAEHARFQVRDAPFPGIVPRTGASVPGLVFPGIDATALARLDEFEGEMYVRTRVRCDTAAGSVDAEAYVIHPDWRSALLDLPWDADAFARDWHQAYLHRLGAAVNPGESR